MEISETNGQDVTAPGAMASGASYSNRINPCTVVPISHTVTGETTTVCGNARRVPQTPTRKHSHCSPYIYEAMEILKDHGYAPFRLTGDRNLPGAVIATKSPVTLMIAVLYSRKQVPDSHTLRARFPETVDYVRALVKTSPHRCMIWISSPVIGWRYYRADIGGISYDWNLAKELNR